MNEEVNEVKKTGDADLLNHLFDTITNKENIRTHQVEIIKNLGINFTQELTDTKLNSDELKKLQAIYDIFQLALLEEGEERTRLLNEFNILAQQDTYFYNKLIQTAAKTTDDKVDLMDMYNIFNQDFSIVSAEVLIECVKELQNMFTDLDKIDFNLEKFKNDDFSIPNCTKEQTGLILNGNNELLKTQIAAYRKNLQNKIDTEKVNKNQSENFKFINNAGLLNDVKPTEKSSTEYKETLKKKVEDHRQYLELYLNNLKEKNQEAIDKEKKEKQRKEEEEETRLKVCLKNIKIENQFEKLEEENKKKWDEEQQEFLKQFAPNMKQNSQHEEKKVDNCSSVISVISVLDTKEQEADTAFLDDENELDKQSYLPRKMIDKLFSKEFKQQPKPIIKETKQTNQKKLNRPRIKPIIKETKQTNQEKLKRFEPLKLEQVNQQTNYKIKPIIKETKQINQEKLNRPRIKPIIPKKDHKILGANTHKIIISEQNCQNIRRASTK